MVSLTGYLVKGCYSVFLKIQTLAIIGTLKMHLALIQTLYSFNVCYNYKAAH